MRRSACWRSWVGAPGRCGPRSAAGFATLALADAIYSVDVLGHSYNAETSFDAVWLAGMMLVAYAAWLPHPGKLEPVRVSGWKAVALPLAAQAFAIIVQLISIVVEVPPSASILTIVVLLIAMVQIVITRPRADDDAARPGRGHPARSRTCTVPLPNRRGSSSSSRIRVWSGSERAPPSSTGHRKRRSRA